MAPSSSGEADTETEVDAESDKEVEGTTVLTVNESSDWFVSSNSAARASIIVLLVMTESLVESLME